MAVATIVGAGVLSLGTGLAVYGSGVTEEAAQVRVEAGVNPVTQPIRFGGAIHPANRGFLVFVEGDVILDANESEGTMAAGGNLVIRANNYQVAIHPPAPTFKAEGDRGYTYLFVGGGVVWDNPNSRVTVENQGFTKITDTTTYTVHVKDSNGATQPYRIVKKDAKYETQPQIEGRSREQSAESVGTPVPRSVIDIAEAFIAYRKSSASLSGCPESVTLRNANGGALPRPITGGQAYVTLEPNTTNVLNLSAAELGAMSEMSFRTKPTASSPLLINVARGSFSGRMPNTAGIGGADAPYILWNFPVATSVQISSGATLEGTLFAPNADVSWQANQNLEGNVIAQRFTHAGGGSEVHDFAFNAELQCFLAPDESPTVPEPTTTEPTTTEPTTTEPTTTEPTTTEPTASEPTGEPTDEDSSTASTAPTETTPTDEDSSPATQPSEEISTDTEPTGGESSSETEPTETAPTNETTSSETPTVSPTSSRGTESPGQSESSDEPDETSSPSTVSGGAVETSAEPEDENGFLPNTGGPHWWVLALAAALLVGGVGLLIWSRRTTRAEPEQPEPTDSHGSPE